MTNDKEQLETKAVYILHNIAVFVGQLSLDTDREAVLCGDIRKDILPIVNQALARGVVLPKWREPAQEPSRQNIINYIEISMANLKVYMQQLPYDHPVKRDYVCSDIPMMIKELLDIHHKRTTEALREEEKSNIMEDIHTVMRRLCCHQDSAYYTNTLNVSSCMDKLKEVRQEIINNW
ncbi:MAG: hypothetical protein WC125_04565 [Bacteroidales bacterium]|jgi:hypothetical protein